MKYLFWFLVVSGVPLIGLLLADIISTFIGKEMILDTDFEIELIFTDILLIICLVVMYRTEF